MSNLSAAKEAVEHHDNAQHRFSGKRTKFDPTRHMSYYGTYDDHDSQTSELALKRRMRWEKTLNVELEKFKMIHTFSPKINPPPSPTIGDVVEVDGKPGRIVRCGIWSTTFFTYDIRDGIIVGGAKLVVQNDKLKDLKIEKPLPLLDLTKYKVDTTCNELLTELTNLQKKQENK